MSVGTRCQVLRSVLVSRFRKEPQAQEARDLGIVWVNYFIFVKILCEVEKRCDAYNIKYLTKFCLGRAIFDIKVFGETRGEQSETKSRRAQFLLPRPYAVPFLSPSASSCPGEKTF